MNKILFSATLLLDDPSERPPDSVLIGVVVVPVLYILFVILRVNNRDAVARGGIGATDGAVNIASVLFFFLLLSGFFWFFGR